MKQLARLWAYSSRYWKMLTTSLVSAGLLGLAAAAPTYLLRHIVDDVFVFKHHHLIIPMAFCFVLIFACKGIFSFMTSYSMHWVGNRVMNDIRSDLFTSVMRYPIAFFHEISTGQLMSYFLNDVQMLQNAASSTIKNGVRSVFETTFLIIFAFTQNWKLACMMLVVGPVMAIIIKTMGRKIKKSSYRIQQEVGMLSDQLQETFTGIREVKAFNAENYHVSRFHTQLQLFFKATMRYVKAEALLPSLIELVTMVGAALAFYVAAQQVISGSITPGQLTAFIASAMLAYAPMKRLINVYGEIQYALAAADRVFAVVDRVVPAQRIGEDLNFYHKIELKNLSFSYVPDRPVLRNINLTLRKGERVGIVGASGSGKSTLIDLLLAFISPLEGQIIIDGHALTPACGALWRRHVGYVGQRPFLFNDTVKNNVAYGRDSVDGSAVSLAVTAADADSFVAQLAHGYETLLGENGNLLSGGQRQRLTIARALAGNPQLLIFDEATASLDAASEDEIKKTLQNLAPDVTVIIVTHRVSLLDAVDRVLLVSNAGVQDVGEDQALHTVAV
jgi:ATP-binding cassette, subfamily B, bacterial MsbA